MSLRRLMFFGFCLAMISSAIAQTPSQPTIWASKPDVAGLEKIVNDRLAAAQTAIDQITSVKGARTIDNTLAPYDETIRQINASLYLSALMQQVHPDATFRDHATEMVRKASAVQTALSLNRDVYHALASLDVSKPGPDGKIYITTNYPDAFPVFKFSKSDDLRRRVSLAFDTRAYPTNKDVLEKMMKTRYEIATLLGYSSWADYNAADKMIKTGTNIADFIQKVDSAARPIAHSEFAMLLAEKRKTDPGANDIWDYEVSYLNEQVRRAQFNFDSQLVRPYLPFNEVRQGILDTAATLFHVTFSREENVPAWDPAVETWDV